MTLSTLAKSSHIDWLSVTAPITDKQPLPPCLDSIKSKYLDGMFGYRKKRKFINGVVELSAPKNARLGTHIIYGGQALANIKKQFGGGIEVLRWHALKGHKITRLDMAIDVVDSGLDSVSLLKQFNDRDVKTSIRSKPSAIVSSVTNVETLYLGSRSTRSKIIRVYDKALERKIYDKDWIRIEYEVRQQNAVRASQFLCENGITFDNISSLIKGFCDFHNDEVWQEIMSGDTKELPTFVEPANNTIDWLLKSCAPALAKEMLKDSSFEQVFYDRVSAEILKYYESYEVVSDSD